MGKIICITDLLFSAAGGR